MEMLNVKIKYKKLFPVSFVFFLVVQRFSTQKAVRVLKELRDGARIFWTFKEPKNPFQGSHFDSSVADPGCFITDPGSRIPDLETAMKDRGVQHNSLYAT